MFNNVFLIGRIFAEPEVVFTKENVETKWAKFILAVKRPYKDYNNEYQDDFIKIKTWLINIEKIKKSLILNNMVAVKARVQSYIGGALNNTHFVELIAEQIVPFK